MTNEKTLVLIKPDAMVKRLAGNIINDLYNLNLKMIGLKLVNVKRELAEMHYSEHKEKPFFEDLIKHLTGELHNNENVIAIAYEGDDAIQKALDNVPQDKIEETLLAEIQRQTDDYNNTPQAELGWLTPDEAFQRNMKK